MLGYVSRAQSCLHDYMSEFYDSFEAIFLGYRLPSMRYKLNNGETVFNQYSSRVHSWTDINRDMDIDMKV